MYHILGVRRSTIENHEYARNVRLDMFSGSLVRIIVDGVISLFALGILSIEHEYMYMNSINTNNKKVNTYIV